MGDLLDDVDRVSLLLARFISQCCGVIHTASKRTGETISPCPMPLASASKFIAIELPAM